MKRKLQIMHDLFEIVQSYEPYTKIAIQENKLSYFDNLKALCHWHDDIEIIYILKGKMNFYVADICCLLYCRIVVLQRISIVNISGRK